MSAGNNRFCIIPARAISDKGLKRSDIMVLNTLGLYGDRKGWSYPSANTIAEITKLDRTSIFRSLNKLVALGYIERRQRKRKNGGLSSNLYRIIFDEPTTEDELPKELEEGEEIIEKGEKNLVASTPLGQCFSHHEGSGTQTTRGVGEMPLAYNKEVTTQPNDPKEKAREAEASGFSLSFDNLENEFELFFDSWPNKVKPKLTREIFIRSRKEVSFEEIMKAVENYKKFKPEYEAVCHPDKWLEKRRWEDRWQAEEQPTKADNKIEQQAKLQVLRELREKKTLEGEFFARMIEKKGLSFYNNWIKGAFCKKHGEVFTLYLKTKFIMNQVQYEITIMTDILAEISPELNFQLNFQK